MLPKGTLLGHYRLLQGIGAGGMGEVYLAEDTRITRQVAIKIVRTEAQPYPNSPVAQEASRLFQREMRAIVMLDHRNILNLIDFGEETIEGMPVTYMVMPYRKEGSLSNWLQRYKTDELLSLADTDYILTQAAEALQHAHEHHIIHQDVKPSNFLIRENPNDPHHPDLLLTDFGVAKLTNATATASQNVRGTPAFMSPEQWEGEPVSASDQYALAVLAYLLLTGRTPFEGRLERVMHQHLMVSPQPPSTFNLQLSPAIDAVILKALAKKPEDRFSTILDFAHAFHQATLYSGDLRTTLTVNPAEAPQGGTRTITLPGMRRVSITVPPGTQDGQELRIEGQGDHYYENGPRGPLFLKIALSSTEAKPDNKNNGEHVPLPATDSASLPATVYAWQKQPGNIPPTLPVGQTLPVANERPVTLPSPSDKDIPFVPSLPQTAPARQTKNRAAIILSIVIAFALVAAIIGVIVYNYVNNLDPYVNPGGTLALNDSLTQDGNWSTQSNTAIGGFCQTMSDGYHISESKTFSFYNCDANSRTVYNFVFEVKMTIDQGDCGGLALLYDPTGGNGYVLFICSDGSYQFTTYTNFASGLLINGTSSGVTAGQTNTIAVVANGGNFIIYLNHSQLNGISDNTYNQGEIGLIAGDNSSNTTEVTYSDARLWTL